MASGLSSFLGGFTGSAIGGATVQLFLDDSRFNAGLAQAEAKTAASTQAMGASTSKFGTYATVAFAAAAAGAVSFAASSVQAFKESQEVMAQTEAVIKSTGGAAGFTAASIKGMAAELQDLTSFSDEEIQSAENLLLTFRRIGHETFPDATKAVLDMSAALGQDLKSSSIQLGKALNDPIAGLTALKRAGIQFTEEQTKLIEKLVASNDILGAQKVILAEVNAEFGGSAVAAAGTYQGKIDQLANTFNDFQEAVGKKLVPALTSLVERLQTIADLLPTVVPWIERTVGAIERGVPFLQAFNDAMGSTVNHFPEFQAGAQAVKASLDNQEISVARAITRIEALAEATGVELPDGAAAMVAAMQAASSGVEDVTDETKKAHHAIQRFAGMTGQDLADWRQGVKDAFSVAGESVFGFKRKFEGTVTQFLRGLDNMAGRAKETLQDFRDFNKIPIGENIRKFLIDQGPAAISAFVDANKKGRDKAVENINGILDAQKKLGGEIDTATGKTNDLKGAMGQLGQKKANPTVTFQYRFTDEDGALKTFMGLQGATG